MPHHHPAGVARQALRRSRGNASAVLERGLAWLIRVRQYLGVNVDHHLIALARSAGIEAVVQGRLREQGERIRLLLGHRRRVALCLLPARLLIQGLPRRGQRLHQQRADLRSQPPSDNHRTVAIRIHVQRPARVLANSLTGLGLPVHDSPAAHDPLDVLGRAGAPHRQQPLLGLGRGHAGQGADLGVGELAAGKRPGQQRQRAQGARHSHVQQLVFDLAADLTRDYAGQPGCEAPSQVLFPQLVQIADRYLRKHVQPLPPASVLDVALSPYYGWVVEALVSAIKPDTAEGEAPELPRYEARRGPGSTAEVDFWTSRDVREVVHSHLNYVVADTAKWEQSAAYVLDTHPLVEAFVKNASLGFAIPYLHNGQAHDYVPDFIARLKSEPPLHLILETKGFDPLEEVKSAAARRWVTAVNAEGSYGRWQYGIAKRIADIAAILTGAVRA